MGVAAARRRMFAVVAVSIVALGLTVGFVAAATAPSPELSTLPTTPELVGLSTPAAIEALHAVGLSYRLESRAPSPGQRLGIVLEQSPAVGTVADLGTTVTLFVAYPRAASEGESQVPATAPGGRLLSRIEIADRACVMAPAGADVSPSIPIGVAIAQATNRGLIMMKVTGSAGGAPRVVAFYGMLQCNTNLPRHRALVWLVEYPNDKILNLNGPCCRQPSPFIGTMYVVVNPKSGIANENFGGQASF